MRTMRRIAAVAAAAALTGLLCAAAPARAQYETLLVSAQAANNVSNHNTFVGLYPLAVFTGPGVTRFGGLISLDTHIASGSGPGQFGLGAWYFYNSSSVDVYELHGNAYFNRNWGVQAGVLGSTHGGGNVVDLFLLYKTSPTASARPAVMQFGIGPFIDPTGGRTTTDLTAFVQGTVFLADRWSLNGSYWYVRDRADFHRFAAGVAYHF